MKTHLIRSISPLLLAAFSLATYASEAPTEVNANSVANIVPAAELVAPLTTPARGAHRRSGARAIASEILSLKNPSFAPDERGELSGWQTTEHGVGNSYTFTADTENALSSPASARIKRYGVEPFGSLQQTIMVHPLWINKTVRLSGALKSEAITAPGGALTLRIDGGSGQILAWNYMDKERVTDTHDWKRFTVDLKIPVGSNALQVGVMLEGSGTLWADDLSIELVY